MLCILYHNKKRNWKSSTHLVGTTSWHPSPSDLLWVIAILVMISTLINIDNITVISALKNKHTPKIITYKDLALVTKGNISCLQV